jgi:hypothetical protein
MGKGTEGHELRGLARGGCYGGNTAFEGCDTLLKDVNSRVPDSAVDVAELLEAEEPCAVSRVVEDIAGCGVNGYRAGVGCWIRLLAERGMVSIEVGEGKVVLGWGLPSVKLESLEVFA